jgi:3'-phosphoadenosine 5'-phosphosulfate sulfotransferase (PAPS reductase)/FAD synthetase
MKYIVPLSGGKDSTATALTLLNKKNKNDLTFVFCDTGFENKKTYEYLDYLKESLQIEIKVLKNEKYQNGFFDLAKAKKRFPSTKARFCTTELKIKPMVDFILSLEDNVNIYQGIRKEESLARSKMNFSDDFFLYYIQKDSKNLYRKKDVLKWLKKFQAIAFRPLLNTTEKEVFEIHKENNILPNPLYSLGFSRVGCFPCIMARKKEVELVSRFFPEIIEEIDQKEKEIKSSFFGPGYIPERFCQNGKFPTINEVSKYVFDPNQKELFEEVKFCRSEISICE